MSSATRDVNSKVWIVKLEHDGDRMELTFTAEGDYRLFMKDKPPEAVVTDIHERTVIGFITAMEHVADFIAGR